MRHAVNLLAAALGLMPASALAAGPAADVEYRAEIEERAVVPCLRLVAERQRPYPGLTARETVAFVRATEAGRRMRERALAEVLPRVRGRPEGERLALYRDVVEDCRRAAATARAPSGPGPEVSRQDALALLRDVMRDAALRRAEAELMAMPWARERVGECLAGRERAGQRQLPESKWVWRACLGALPPFPALREALAGAMLAEEEEALR